MPETPPHTHAWTEPATEAVASGVHRIPLPLRFDALQAVNVYAIENGDDLVLVDAGWALEEAREALEDGLARIDRDLGQVRLFLVTHMHRDHYTMATVVRRLFGSRIALGEHERRSIRAVREDGPLDKPIPSISRLYAFGASELAERLLEQDDWDPEDPATWEDPDEWLTHGDRITVGDRTLEVVHTPGHTQGHVVFVDQPAGLVFSGDHILPHITPSIGFERIRAERPLGDYIRSLSFMLQLPDMRMLPAHGPVTEAVHPRVHELLDHHRDRLARTADTVVHGAQTAYESARLLRWTRHQRHFDEFNGFNQMLAVSETAAHLDVLADQGRVVAHRDGEVTRYTPAA